MVCNMTGFAEGLDEVVGRVAIILNNEKAHGRSLFAAFLTTRTKRCSPMIILPQPP
jgi:hypothetical protein